MKKSLLLCSFLIVSLTMLAQTPMTSEFKILSDVLSNIDKMGVDESLFLTELEGRYLNALYRTERRQFNMCGKKVAFLTGTVGKTISNKKIYFELERNVLKSNYLPSPDALYIFNAAQKEKTGGYDAAIIYLTKKWPISVRQVVKTLKKQLVE